MSKPRIATIWLDGCSGCHMSFLDMDERLLVLAEKVDVVYGPLADTKEYPEGVDVCLVEGAVSSEEDLHKILTVRGRTRIVISFGDCAVTSNVPSMRNSHTTEAVLHRGYVENATLNRRPPDRIVPRLLPKARPVHEVVKVDIHLPGCPPSADAIFQVLTDLLEGRAPEPHLISRFGA